MDSTFQNYQADIDKPLHEAAADKIRDYCAEYNNRPFHSISFIPAVAITSGRLHCELVRILLLQAHRETGNRFVAASGVEHAQHNQDQFRFRNASFCSQLESKVGNILANATALLINRNIDGAPIASRTLSHPTHKPLVSYSLPSP